MDKEFLKVLLNARNDVHYNRYYANSYLENIYPDVMDIRHINMFKNGEGKELSKKSGNKEKGACLYSSSILSYNFFHWIDESHILALDGVEYDVVVFEEQFRVLKNRNNRANIDVVLVSKDRKTILLLESKFTEHLKHSLVEIRPSYDQPYSYFSNGVDWVNRIEALRKMMSDAPNGAYYEGLKQVACHLMGISNVILDKSARIWFNDHSWLNKLYGIKLNGDEEFIFKSIVFHPKTKDAGILSGDYEKLNKSFLSTINYLPLIPLNLHIDNPIITYRDLWKGGAEKSIQDAKLKEYLEKYLAAHE